MMEQREKLIELMLKCNKDNELFYCFPGRPRYRQAAEILADHLIDDGVVVLPCNVGDTVYQIGRDFCDKRSHDKCDVYCDGWDDLCPESNGEWEIQTRVFTVGLFELVGKSIYLTREEAEKALEKRKGG